MLIQVGELFAQFFASFLFYISPGFSSGSRVPSYQSTIICHTYMRKISATLHMGNTRLCFEELLVQFLGRALINLQSNIKLIYV